MTRKSVRYRTFGNLTDEQEKSFWGPEGKFGVRPEGFCVSQPIAAYQGAQRRCNDSGSRAWKDYGGRGIQFRFANFEQFFAAIGFPPTDKHTLDRIDTDGHYEPGNIRWATKKEQRENQRRNGKKKVA